MEICYKMPSHTLKTLGDKVIRLYSAMIGRLSMPAILDTTYKRFVISSQFCMSINFVPFLVAFWLAISHQAHFFAYDFVEYLFCTSCYCRRNNFIQLTTFCRVQHPPTSLYATLFVILCCTIVVPVLAAKVFTRLWRRCFVAERCFFHEFVRKIANRNVCY